MESNRPKIFCDQIVVNIGREVGKGLEDVVHYIERDSTYVGLSQYLYGFLSEKNILTIDKSTNSALIDGVPVHFLQETRNPIEIPWRNFGVRTVVDTTGQFLETLLYHLIISKVQFEAI